MNRIAFRVDASTQIGIGHVMRCLALADVLSDRNAKCIFICRTHVGHLLDLIAQRGHQSLALPQRQHEGLLDQSGSIYGKWLGTDWVTDATDTQRALDLEVGSKRLDWMVVDHYALDRSWELTLRSSAKRIMAIDDLADRPHDCDLLLDQNLGRTLLDYSSLVSPSAIALMGPKYALLRPEFAKLRPYSLKRRDSIRLKNILIAMGGIDKDNATGQVLDVLNSCSLPQDIAITVVMGKNAPCLTQIKIQAEQMLRPTQVLIDVSDIAKIIAESDLAIGAAGGSAWERCCLGLPSLIIVLADNQEAGANALENTGAAILVKEYQQIPQVLDELQSLGFKNKTLLDLAQASFAVTDGFGSERVAQQMLAEYA